MGPPRLWIAALIATLALGLGYQAYTRVDRPSLADQAAVLLLGPLPLLAFAARRAATPLRRMAWIVPLHLALVFAFGVWHEGRLWLSLHPILVPLAWQALFPPGTEPERKPSAAA